MQDFSPPRDDAAAQQVPVDDLVPPRPGPLVYLAVIAAFLAGFFGFADAVQLYLMVFFRVWWMAYLPYVFGLIAGSVLVCAGFTLRLRANAAIALAALCVLQVLVAVAWQIYAVLVPLIDPMGLIWLVLSLPAAALAPFAVPKAIEATTFRRRLLEDL